MRVKRYRYIELSRDNGQEFIWTCDEKRLKKKLSELPAAYCSGVRVIYCFIAGRSHT